MSRESQNNYTSDRLIRVLEAHLAVHADRLEDEVTEVVAGILFSAKVRGMAITGITQRALMMAANAEPANG